MCEERLKKFEILFLGNQWVRQLDLLNIVDNFAEKTARYLNFYWISCLFVI